MPDSEMISVVDNTCTSITQTCSCTILQFFRGENGNFFMLHISYFCFQHNSWVHARTASVRQF